MAQAVRHDDVELESLLSQAKEKSLLFQKQVKGDGHIHGAYVPAGELHYANPKGWVITPLLAVLVGSKELHVSGIYPTELLEKEFTYEVSFEAKVTHFCNIKEVELKLTLPDGSVQLHIEDLSECPRNVPISLKVGEFFNRFESGDIKFELTGTEIETLKKGLVIFGVLIKAVPDLIKKLSTS